VTHEFDSLYRDIRIEREKQKKKFGADQYKEKSDDRCLAILVEEVGEAANELNGQHSGTEPLDYDRLRKELIQVATVAMAWIEAIKYR
jgi:NTP pyrophosphatase (non-canonical NTP hydrolase)